MTLLAALGLTFIVTDSMIFMPFRNWFSLKAKKDKRLKWFDNVINCPQCFGFWSGLVLAFLFNEDVIQLALTTSFLSFVVNKCLFALK